VNKQITDWYDYPQYFELAFADETRLEAEFFEAAFKKYCDFPIRSVLEPGCGGGRLMVEMARRGYEVIGFDASTKSIDYLRKRIARGKLTANVFHGDLANFELDHPVDSAFSTFNTFRHLITERTAESHLRQVARSLRAGGIYILGFHLLPLDVSEECTERWSARRGKTDVAFTLRVVATDRRRRIEQIRISMKVQTPTKTLRLRNEFPLRMYTATQFRRLLKKIPEFWLCDVYDFWYDIETPLKLDDEITDTLFILRRV